MECLWSACGLDMHSGAGMDGAGPGGGDRDGAFHRSTQLWQWIGARLSGSHRRELERFYSESHRTLARTYDSDGHDCLAPTGPMDG